LSKSARPVIEATLPVVGQHIAVIAERFYQHMFDAHPELLDGIFNRGNQAEGSQQAALAGSVATFVFDFDGGISRGTIVADAMTFDANGLVVVYRRTK